MRTYIFLLLVATSSLMGMEKQSEVEENDSLYIAAQEGQDDSIIVLTGRQARIDAPNTVEGYEAIHVAAFEGRHSMVELLISLGARPDARSRRQGIQPIHLAAEEGHLDVVKMLVKNGASVNSRTDLGGTALQFAAQFGHEEVVRWLIGENSDLNAVNSQGNTALIDALLGGHTNVARFLIESGADVNIVNNNESPIRIANRRGYHDISVLILSCLDPHMLSLALFASALDSEHCLKNLKLFLKDDSNYHADSLILMLNMAVLECNPHVVDLLLKRPIDVNVRNDKGYAPIHVAVANRNPRMLSKLLDHGANPFALTSTSRPYNALDLAAHFGDELSIERLLEWGVPISGTSHGKQKSLLDIALIYGHKELAEWLVIHGAEMSDANRHALVTLYNAEGKTLLSAIIGGFFAEANVISGRYYYGDELLDARQLGRGLQLAIALGYKELVDTIIDNFKTYLVTNLDSVGLRDYRDGALQKALISAAIRGNWSTFIKIKNLLKKKLFDREVERAFLLAGNARFVKEFCPLAFDVLGARLLDISKKTVLRSARLGRDKIIACIVENVPELFHEHDRKMRYPERHVDFELVELLERLRVFLDHEDMPREFRTASRLHDLSVVLGEDLVGAYVTPESLEEDMHNAAVEGNWDDFEKMCPLVDEKIEERMQHIMQDALRVSATDPRNLSFFENVYQLAQATLTPDIFLSALNDALENAVLGGSEEIVAYILQHAFTDTDHGQLGLDIGRSGRLARSRLSEEGLSEEYKAALDRIFKSLALIGHMRQTNTQANNQSVINSLGGVLAATGNEFAAAIPAEVLALILDMAFHPANKQD